MLDEMREAALRRRLVARSVLDPEADCRRRDAGNVLREDANPVRELGLLDARVGTRLGAGGGASGARPLTPWVAPLSDQRSPQR